MFQTACTLLRPLITLLLIGLGSGLFSTFLSVRLEMMGYNANAIGVMGSLFYVGCLLGSIKTDRWIVRVGHRKALLLAIPSIGLLLFFQSLFTSYLVWALFRLLVGFATGILFIAIESWFLVFSTKEKRGETFSLYLIILYSSLSAGQFFLDIAPPETNLPFFLASFLSLLAAFPLLKQEQQLPHIAESAPLSLRQVFQLSPIGFLGGTIAGMLLSSTYGLLPAFALSIGLTTSEIAFLMGIVILGGLSLQWPFGKLADITSRKKTLLLASFLTLAMAISLIFFGRTPLLLPLAALYGAFSFTIYPLSMGYTCQAIREEEMVSATSGFVLSWGIGSVAGPTLAGLSMQILGPEGLFFFIALTTLLFLSVTFVTAKEKVPM